MFSSVSVSLSVCLLPRLLKNYSTDFDETLQVGRTLQVLETMNFLTLRSKVKVTKIQDEIYK